MIPPTYRSILVDEDGVVVHQKDLEGRTYKTIERRSIRRTDESGQEIIEIVYMVKVSPWKQLKLNL